MDRDPMNDLLRTAVDAAEAAASVHAANLGTLDPGSADRKAGFRNFVSRVDLESQEAALEVIRGRFPEHRIMAEEGEDEALEEADGRGAAPSGADASGSDSSGAAGGAPDAPIWIVDPLDGTTNYLHGHPQHAASVAVVVDGRVEAGAVVSAGTGERWWAARGEGAWMDGKSVSVSAVDMMEDALVGTGFPFKVPHLLPRYLAQLGTVLKTASGVRRDGAAAMDLCYLAMGRFDGFWELYLNPWDVAAGLVILAEAGGVCSRVDGSPLEPTRSGSVLAANSPKLLAALKKTLEGGASTAEES